MCSWPRWSKPSDLRDGPYLDLTENVSVLVTGSERAAVRLYLNPYPDTSTKHVHVSADRSKKDWKTEVMPGFVPRLHC